MTGILLLSHGGLSKGIMETFECIMGSTEKIIALTLSIDDDTDAFGEEISKSIDSLDEGDGVLVLVDILGGTPSNKSALLLKGKNIEVIAGLNFPMLIAAEEARLSGKSLKEIKEHCLKCGNEGIVSLREYLGLN